MINLSALDEPVSKEALTAYKKRYFPQTLVFGLSIGSLVIFGVLTVVLIYSGIAAYLHSEEQRLIGIGLVALGLMPLLALVRLALTNRRRLLSGYLAQRIASMNRFYYTAQENQNLNQGIIFADQKFKDSFTYNRVASTMRSSFEIGNYYRSAGSGTDYIVGDHMYGYLRIRLNSKLPHVLLRSTSRRPSDRLGLVKVPFTDDQVLSLEGDFNKYFTLYAPKGYERDVLYIFTPDLMALFVDNVANFSAEIVDHTLYVYSGKPFDFSDRATLERLDSILEALSAKIMRQTNKYADYRAARVGDVAVQGRRLRQRLPLVVGFLLLIFLVTIVIAYLF